MSNRLWLLAFVALPIACVSPRDRARADSAQALAARQRVLMDQLVAQKDSVNRVLTDADNFIGEIDRSVSRVKGMKARHVSRGSESGIEDQIAARKDMLRRVNALVARAQETARELQEARQKEAELVAENGRMKDSLDADGKKITELQTSIAQQAETIAMLQAHVDSLGKEVTAARAAYARAYYVVGTEDELLQKGIVVREGGANLLFAHIGRTLQPARDLDPQVFTSIDTRDTHMIPVPDTTRRYQIVSRQSLDDAKVENRDGSTFRGELAIADIDRFWAPSHFLILVER